MKLPKQLFCRVIDDEKTEAPWLNAELSIENAVGDERSVTKVGIYRLVETKLVQRQLQVLTTKKGQ